MAATHRRIFIRYLGPVSDYACLAVALTGALSCGERSNAVRHPGITEKYTSRRELRELADAYVCWMRGDSSEAFSPVLGDLGCHSVANEQLSTLAALVERTVADTIPILRFSMDASASQLALACPAPPGVGVTAPATPCLSDGFWTDANLGGVLDLGLSRAVGNAGWRCDDCETAEPFREQIATSETLMPFVSAYVWPVESDGGKSVEILICSGANGASTTDGNPILLRLGFLVAQGFVESAVIRPELARLADLGRKGTAKLHEIEVELARLLASTSAKQIACEVSDRFSWYTRVRLSDCRRFDGA